MIGSSIVATGIVQYSKIASMSLNVFSSAMGVVLPMTVAMFNAHNSKLLERLKTDHQKLFKQIFPKKFKETNEKTTLLDANNVNSLAMSENIEKENNVNYLKMENTLLKYNTNMDFSELEVWSKLSIFLYGSVVVLNVTCNSLSAGLSGLPNMDIAITVLNIVATIAGYLSAALSSYFSSIHHSNIKRANLLSEKLNTKLNISRANK